MGNGIILLAAAVLVVSFPPYATTWSDDFESYTVGDYLSDYPDWTDKFYFDDYPGHFVVADYDGNKAVNPDWYDRCVYEPPGVLTDSKVSFDVLFTGGCSNAGAIFRYNDIGDYLGYEVSVTKDHWSLETDVVMVGIYDADSTLYWDIFYLGDDYFDEDVWYHLGITLWGVDPLHYQVTVNGAILIFEEQDLPPPQVIESGLCGLVGYYHDGIVYVDNYEVDDEVTIGVQPTSLGALKAAFR